MKKSILLLVSTILLLVLTACSGTGDWIYELPNGYELWRINSNEILIKYAQSEVDGEGIPSFVKEFSYDERYVFTRNVDDISSNDIFDEIYYVLDTQEKKVHGPFESSEELQGKVEEWDVGLPEKWYRTSPDPNLSK